MSQSEIITLFLALSLCSLGVFLGTIGNKIVTVKYTTNWKWSFYIFSGLSIIGSIIFSCMFFLEIVFINFFISGVLLISGMGLFVFTYKYLDRRYIYKTTELDPIINKFTEESDKNEIKLFGGDLNFFGNAPSDLDKNSQYNFLKASNFKRTLILCEEPRDSLTKIRYGKLLHELKGVELRFYNPDTADLRIRGRMKETQGVVKLLIYSKVTNTSKYQTIETDTANSDGALYKNIWNLIWSLANKIDTSQQTEYIRLFKCE
jgi:hypothetical protein